MQETLEIEPKEVKPLSKYTRDEVHKATLEYFNGDTLATEVWINKYCLKDSDGNLYEKTPDDMHWRLANELARVESKYPNPLSAQQIYDKIKNFKKIVPQGSPMSGIGNDFQTVSISNCFVIGNEVDADSYGGIFKLDQEIAQLQKRRAGVGVDLSFIRPKGSQVKNSALTSTGVIPFMERFSNTTREVAQDGRRGALMESIAIKHPDAEDFIDAKMTQGKVTGANVSVRIDDGFMNAATQGTTYTQQYPVDAVVPKVTKEINASKLWKKIYHNAWKSAEPGILFWDTIIKESIPDCYADEGFKTVSTNPCIIGSTLIAVADGRNAVSIETLMKEGNDIPVYSTNPKTGQREIKMGRNPRMTKKNTEVWKLILDDGSELIATPDHKIMKKDLSYINLKELKEGDSLNPFYSFNSNGYRQISSVGKKMKGGAFRNRRQYRVIHEFISNLNVNPKTHAIHHKDFNSLNDAFDNLEIMLHEEHRKLHAEKMSGKNNPYHKMNDEWKLNFATHSGEENGRYSGHSNDELIKEGKKLFNKNGKITNKIWCEYAKKHGLPQFLGNDFRFKTWDNFKNQIATNHKVKSVEFYGYDNVYNITVDDNHNYDVITKFDDNNYITSAGITIKNCGEITLCPNDSCRLLAINLYGYVSNPFTKKASFDWDEFKKDVIISERLMDDIVDLELEKIDKILEKLINDPEQDHIKLGEITLWKNIKDKAERGRRTGLGITAEGDMIAALGLKYGTDKANKFSIEVHKQLKLEAYRSSVIMAKERGAFPMWNPEKEKKNPFLLRIKDEDSSLYRLMRKYGRRNLALLTIAPTGSVSIMTQTSSGIECVFLVYYTRRRKINPNDKNVRVDFTDEVGDTWMEYPVFHHKFEDFLEANGYDVDEVKNKYTKNQIDELIKKSPYHGATSNNVDWVKKVEMQGGIQQHVDHSISVTVNLPNDISEEMVGKVYEMGWRSGCKGITVYRDGSRSGVLISETEKEKKKKDKLFDDHHAPKRPKRMKGEIVRFQNNLEKWVGVVGLLDGRPYEIFTGLNENGLSDLPASVIECEIVKNRIEDGTKRYDIEYVDSNGEKHVHTGLNHTFNSEYWNYAKMISSVLRHGMPIPYVLDLVKSLNLNDEHLNTWKNGVARVIKKYVKDGEKGEGTCPNCGSENLEYKEGCLICMGCSSSKCG